MKGFKKSLFLPALLVPVTLMITMGFVKVNISYGEAVPLIPINTGNVTLDKGLPVFYECIDKNDLKDNTDSFNRPPSYY